MFFHDQYITSYVTEYTKQLYEQSRHYNTVKPSKQIANILRQIAKQIDPNVETDLNGGSYVHT